METQTLPNNNESDIDIQQRNSTNNILQLDDSVSIHRHDGHEIHVLNLDRCLRQSYTINDVSSNETIGRISLMHNYLKQIPSFVSHYTNLIELNVSHNELSDTEFILHRPFDDSELTESYWNEFFQKNSNYFIPEHPYKLKEDSCQDVPQKIDLSNKNLTIDKQSKLSTYLPTRQMPRPLVHPFLENINLSFNHIRYLPTNIHYLRFLHTLNLSHNYLKELPSNIDLLAQLSTLIIDHNYLEILPLTFNRLNQLEFLDLSHNNIQSIDLIKNFSKLKTFSINSNPLKHFPMLLHTCSNIEHLSFSNVQLQQMNNITIDIFTQFSNLKRLNLSNNNLENNFLSRSIEQFNHLEELDLQHNRLTNIFSLLSRMTSLNALNLNYNSLTKIPECTNTNLTILCLSNNQIILNSSECIYLKHIIELNLDHNQIEYIPNEFIQCLHLQSLNVSFNPLRKFPDIILQLRSLNKLIIKQATFQYLPTKKLVNKYFYRTINILDLSNNYLHTDLIELTGLKALTYLDLSHNQLYEINENFRLLSCLQILKLNNNKFIKFPSCLYEMSNDDNQKLISENLMELYLNNNKIESIPEDIVHMTNLHTIDLSNNQFMKFPEQLIYLEQLTTLSYSQQYGRNISKLPNDFNQLFNLKHVDLSHNIFKDIPNMIYTLSKLEYLNMSYNLLSSIDHKRLEKLKNFKSLLLNGNNFTSFPSKLYRLETLNINDNSMCLAPPNDFIDEKYISAASNFFVQINDKYEENIFDTYQRIFIEHLTSYDIENLVKRCKLSEADLNNFRNNSTNLKRENKIELVFKMWKEKRGPLANADTLYKLAYLIGDKNLVRHMQRAYLLARTIRL